MKEVQVFLLCDTCHENGDRREAVERTVSVDGQTAVVAACEEHMAPIVDVLAMIALGVEPEADRPVNCAPTRVRLALRWGSTCCSITR